MIDYAFFQTLALPEMVLSAMILLILLVDAYFPKRFMLIYGLAQTSVLASLLVVALGFSVVPQYGFDMQYVQDGLSSLLKLVMLIIMFFVFIYTRRAVRETLKMKSEFFILTLLSLLGCMIMVSSSSLLSIYLGVELFALPIYALIALERDCAYASEAAMKYFIMGAVASALLLYGISLLYGLSGSLVFKDIALFVQGGMSQSPILLFALVFIVAALCFKLGAVPFHMWLPDVYEGGALSVVSYLGSVPKLAALGFLVRILIDTLPGLGDHWQILLLCFGMLSIIVGNVCALVQQNILRLLAYSTISHVGFILLGLAEGGIAGYHAALFYTIIYAMMAASTFGVLLIIRTGGGKAQEISDLAGLNEQQPWLAFMFLLLIVSLAGIPPLLGFDAKLLVLLALAHAGHYVMVTIALVMSVIGGFYYFRILRMMYFEKPKSTLNVQMRMSTLLVISSNGILLVLLGLFPTSLIDICKIVIA